MDGEPLSGTLVTVPFSCALDTYLATVRSQYEDLVAKHGSDRVLILTRYPAGTQELEANLAEAVDTIDRPTVAVLSAHAHRVLEELDPAPEMFDRDRRVVLVRQFLAEQDWETSYLQRAAGTDGFKRDFLRFLVAASYQQRPEEISDDALRELYAAVDAFHTYCRETLPARYELDRSFIDRSAALVAATELLETSAVGIGVRSEFDAVLTLEFEEFDRTSRAYLANLTADRDLVAVAREESAIRRPFSEPGRIEDRAATLTRASAEGDAIGTPIQAVSTYLATGTAPVVDLAGNVGIIEGDTFRDHVQAVATQIQRLRRQVDVPYDEMAVILRDSKAPVEEANDILRSQGLPTTSATVRGLEHDPVARELLAVARRLATQRATAPSAGDSAYATLVARVGQVHGPDSAHEQVDEALEAAAAAPDVHAGLWRWIIRSGLKERIATTAAPLEARVRYQHVTQLTDLAAFISHEVIDGDWTLFVDELEERFETAAVDRISEELDTVDGAVRVDAARTVKTHEYEAVFLLGVVEGEYPTEPQFEALFPRARLRTLDAYPTVTSPSPADVRQTFASMTADAGDTIAMADPLKAYYAGVSRRILAIGARAARDWLYLCTYKQEQGLGRRRRPSRFLQALEDHFGSIDRIDPTERHENDPHRFALTRLEAALDRIQQCAIRDETVDFERIDREFGAVQHILETTDAAATGSATDASSETLRRALEANIDFTRGDVRRE
jgi:nitroreductase